jgi:hypothetical protein
LDLDLTENIKYLIFDALKEYFQISNKLITIYLDILIKIKTALTNSIDQLRKIDQFRKINKNFS